jgi:hypothetical protein
MVGANSGRQAASQSISRRINHGFDCILINSIAPLMAREQAVLAQVAGSDLPPRMPTRPSIHRETKRLTRRWGHLQMLFRICRRGMPSRWVVLLDDSFYGAYADKDDALLDAVEAATDARDRGSEAEVWDQIKAVRLY